MPSFLYVSLALAAVSQAHPAVIQQTSGWCSPAIANVVGNVTVNCIGVDPRALKRLNEELSGRHLQLADKIHEADKWATRYKELESQFSAGNDDSALARRAEDLLHAGDLDQAGAILDQILAKQEPKVDRFAANHYRRALVFELQFRPLDALPHFEKAYQYRPDEVSYGLHYASALAAEHDFKRAEPVFLAILARIVELAKVNSEYLPVFAGTLNDLANLYRDTQRLKDAETLYLQALDVRRELARADPVFRVDLAQSLDTLASLYRDTQRLAAAEAAYSEALNIWRDLAKANSAYALGLGDTLNNKAILYKRSGRLNEAESAYKEALETFRQLAKANPIAYRFQVSVALNNLGNLYRAEQSNQQAEPALMEALEIRRQMAQEDPAAYQPYVAGTLNNIANLYLTTKRPKEAQASYQESLDLYRQLAKDNAAGFTPYVANTLSNIAALHSNLGNSEQARREIEEAVAIRRDLWKANPEAMGDEFAKSLYILSQVLTSTHESTSSICPLLREASSVAYDPDLKELAGNARLATCEP